MMTTRNSPLRINELSRFYKEILRHHHHGFGLVVLLATLLGLSLLAGLHPSMQSREFKSGEIADSDIIAHRDITVEDPQAGQTRREQVAQLQPTVFDLSVAEITALRQRIFALLQVLNDHDSTEAEDVLRLQVKEFLGEPVNSDALALWMQPNVQQYIIGVALPWIESRLQEGVVSDARLALPAKNGILIRDMDTGQEDIKTNVADIRDISALLMIFAQKLRADEALDTPMRRAVFSLFSPLVMPTLTLNREATLALGRVASQKVEPVLHTIRKGEIIVYQGERISREKHLKLQALFQQKEGLIQARTVAGVLTVSTLLSLGLFMAPSGRPGTKLRRKDLLFISLLLFGFGLGAKDSYFLVARLVQPQEVALSVYFFPIAGAAGLCALIFAARRYCVVGLMLALFSAILLKGNLPLFLFFFLSAMLNTWLVIRAQSRQDVVVSLIPLTIGLVIIATGCGWLEGFRGTDAFLRLAGAACINALISVATLFAVSPIIEMAFGYTTRFRLMELMNLEQPLMQELMVTIPGTYHHSLVVANMVEAGAKAVGANSLLCKVAALYHDVGKLAYPDYFIENQYNGPNRHDRLAPNMSALILMSHVKKGTELANKHRVGDEITEIIQQHHGTGLIKYFYSKSRQMGENPRLEDYCYAGPRPQTREAAIVMLADAVEASSRTLSEPTPARIKNHVDTIMKGIFSDGQLDESELTFKDLHKLSENFARILTGLFHQRIAYPADTKQNPDREPAVCRTSVNTPPLHAAPLVLALPNPGENRSEVSRLSLSDPTIQRGQRP